MNDQLHDTTVPEADRADEDAGFASAFEVTYSDSSQASDLIPEEATPAASAQGGDVTPAAAPAAPAAAAPAAAPAAPAAAPAAPAAADVADPYEGFNDTVRTQLALIPQLSQQLSTAAGRLAALQREIATLRARPAPNEAPAPQQRQQIPEVERLRNDMPDAADAVYAAIDHVSRRAPAEAPPASESQANPDAEHEAREVATLNQLDPNWGRKVKSTEFALWLTTTPAEYQQLVNSAETAAPVVDAIRQFDGYMGRLQAQRQAAANAAAQAAAVAASRQSRVAGAAAPVRGNGRVPPPQIEDEASAFEDGFNNPTFV